MAAKKNRRTAPSRPTRSKDKRTSDTDGGEVGASPAVPPAPSASPPAAPRTPIPSNRPEPRRATTSSRAVSHSTTREMAALVASQARTRTGTVLALLAVLAGVGAGTTIVLRRQAASDPPAADAPLAAAPLPGQPAPAPGSAAPGAPRPPAAKAAKPSKAIASLVRSPALEAPPAPIGGPNVPRVNPYELARSIAADKSSAVQLCYERELKRNPRLKGSVTVDLQLTAPHEIGQVRVLDNLKSRRFTRCVRSALKRIDFPVLREDLSIEIPFALTSPDF